MSWIKEISPNKNKQLKKIYESAENRTGEETANVLKVHSIKVKTLEAHMLLYETIMFGESELSRGQREMIGLVVSTANQCPYCASHHGHAMVHVTENMDLMKEIADDYRQANLNEMDMAICQYAEKLTKTSYKMVEDDINKLRHVGLSD